jgi:phage terminase large subunit-like protein
MLAFAADGLVQGKSPDRLDALVWALTELILDAPPRPAVRML